RRLGRPFLPSRLAVTLPPNPSQRHDPNMVLFLLVRGRSAVRARSPLRNGTWPIHREAISLLEPAGRVAERGMSGRGQQYSRTHFAPGSPIAEKRRREQRSRVTCNLDRDLLPEPARNPGS